MMRDFVSATGQWRGVAMDAKGGGRARPMETLTREASGLDLQGRMIGLHLLCCRITHGVSVRVPREWYH